jgi:5'-nucleotidase
MIDWVFLDVGDVLFNDDPQNFLGYRFVYEVIRARHPDYTFGDMLAEREAAALEGHDFILSRIARRLLPADDVKPLLQSLRQELIGSYDENNMLNEGARKAIEVLRPQWRLGIIANQPIECRQSLARRGLLDSFDVVAISDEVEFHKPDVRLYEWAIAQAGCEPVRAVMIGDRRDNDIAPASQAGMRTIQVRWPDCRSKGWQPIDPMAQQFLDSCCRVPIFSAVPVGPEPDAVITSLAEAPAAVARLAAAKNSKSNR